MEQQSNDGITLQQETGTDWAHDVDQPAPMELRNAHQVGVLPPHLGELKVRLSINIWPEGHPEHFHARLKDSLLEVMQDGAKALGVTLLPPGKAKPFDALRNREHHHWSDPLVDLEEPLWMALARGASRHFGLELKLAVKINTKWRIASAPDLTPRQLLNEFGFDPTEFTLYRADSSTELPPDTPIHLTRGDQFEAQKNGRYGSPVASVAGIDAALAEEVAALREGGLEARLLVSNGQRYIEVSGLVIPSPPWSKSAANILIAIPETYPSGGLDAFYLEQTVSHANGAIPYQQNVIHIEGRSWALISWHYAVNRPWYPHRDDVSSHIAHCRGFFFSRGIK